METGEKGSEVQDTEAGEERWRPASHSLSLSLSSSVFIFCACMYICVPHAYLCLQRPEEVVRAPVTHDPQPLCGYCG